MTNLEQVTDVVVGAIQLPVPLGILLFCSVVAFGAGRGMGKHD